MYATSGRGINSSAQILDGVVATADLADDAVTDAKIGAHTSTKITIKLVNKGLDASKPASPLAGEVYIATDTKKVYLCVTATAWENITAEILDSAGSQGDVLYKGASGWVRLAAGTSGHFLKTNGAAANPEWAAAGASYATASDTLKFSADTVRNNTDTNYILVKSIQCFYAGIIRVKYETQGVGSPDTDTLIYLNGTSTGIGERNSTNNYVAYSHDIYVSAGDQVQLYVKRTGGTSNNCKNFRLCFTLNAMSIDGQVITN